MEKYAVYLRKSRKDAELERYGEGETLARHKAALLELAQRKSLNVTEIYEEIVSGESISARPQMQRLLRDVENNQFDGVLVMELERLARGDTKDQGVVAEAFKFTNTLIITPNKTYDPMNEFDEEYFEFGLFMSRREYKTINRRLQAGRIASVKEGNYIGSSPPFGYDKIKTAHKSYSLVPNNQSEYVKLIFDMYVLQKLTVGQIANKLNELCIKPLRSDKWSRESIREILSNPVYIGKLRWNRRPMKKVYSTGILHIERPRQSNVLIVDGSHPPIISEELFENAQKIRMANARRPSVNHEKRLVNPLAHLVKCENCGKSIIMQTSKDKYRLVCNNKYCHISSSLFSDVENAVIESLKIKLEKIKISSEYQDNNEYSSAQTVAKAISNEIEYLNAQQNKLYDLLERGIYSEDIFFSRRQNITERLQKLQNQLDEMRNISLQQSENKDIETEITAVLSEYPYADAKAKNEFLSEVIQQIIYSREKSDRFHQKPVHIKLFMKF